MKIIDLLNKIANGEDVPDAIKYKSNIYGYDGENQNYVRSINFTFDFLIGEDITAMLNDEVEVIKEEKKIPEKIKDKYCSQISKVELAQKYNEIIDYLEYLNSKGE